MTGYGRGESSQDGFKVTVEASAVNRKQSEIQVNLPRELESLEALVRDEVNRRVARGRLTLRVGLVAAKDRQAARVQLNQPIARAYVQAARRLARSLKLESRLSLDTLLRLPGVVETESPPADAEAFWPAVRSALEKALTRLVRMRAREGAHLARDLKTRVAAMRRVAIQVQRLAPGVARRYQEQLCERLRQAGVEDLVADDERLLKEVAIFADRSDISEELTRLQSHFRQFDDCLGSDEPVGRTLDFLAQELNREVNTIGSKANDGAIARAVVTLKAELEKFREQVQNIE
jgi:uncharacterized protein (TIGR00255 family)